MLADVIALLEKSATQGHLFIQHSGALLRVEWKYQTMAELIGGNKLKIHQGAEQIAVDPFHHAVRPALFQCAPAHGLLDEITRVLLGHFACLRSVFEPKYFADEIVQDEVRAGGVDQDQLAQQTTRDAVQQEMA